jgi:hypothetical protein
VAALQRGQGAPAQPQAHACGPCHGWSGWFSQTQPVAVCKPLSEILHRPVKIDAFQQHLKKFITEQRANILVRRGHDRAFRFRFREPMMQPFVIMRGIEQGLVDPKAIDVLSFPAQTRLPI